VPTSSHRGEIIDTLIEAGATVGSAVLTAAAPKIALSLGSDVGADLERLDSEPGVS
jgi:hypothetical protein